MKTTKHTLSKLAGSILLSTVTTVAMANELSNVSNNTDRLIIKYASPMNAMAISSDPVIANITGNQLLNVRPLTNGASVVDLGELKSLEDMQELAAEIAQQSNVLYAEPDYMMYPMATPNDTRYNEQWHYFESAGGINLPAAWDITTGSPNITVAVIDTGIRAHADLTPNIVSGYDFITNTNVSQDGNGRDSDASDPGDWTPAGACGNGYPPSTTESSWHGTHVAGTISAASNNNTGIAGVSWNTKIQPIRVLGRCGGYTSDIVDGMRWAAGLSVSGVPANPTPAKVLNLSLGGGSPCSQTYKDAINSVRAAGATIVVAAGNSNQDASGFSPASCDGVITVASNKRDGGRAFYSNFGSVVDVAAPGGETQNPANGVLSTLNGGSQTPGNDSYAFYQGTSMAAPHVAGVAALMYSVKSDLTPDQVETTIENTARAFPSVSTRQCSTSSCGAGIVDAHAALQAVNGGGTTPPPSDNDLEKGVAKSGLNGSSGQQLEYTFEVPAGASNLSFNMSGGTGDADLYVRHGSKPTTSSFDCRPYRSGNTESCSFSSPSTGTWHVMLRGYSAFSGVSLVADYTASSGGGNSDEFSNTTPVAIPDNKTTGVTSSVNSTRSGDSGTVTVSVNITHTYRGDLKIQLVAPNGQTSVLKEVSNDSADNLVTSYQVNMSGVESRGSWSLKVSDHYRRDTGTLNSWSIRF
ncbi:S8 family serine peptidase [Endozoicomonas numazuensis]|uniref:S8 family serine peptidase n=1 Tax=Endozoicomonas numazuensis TaxID=1137799 RepID=UPI00068EB90E|nr:S8 family serine peptidase [Endozoicomonas numazuensis]